MALPMRSSAKQNAEADTKAVDYALWILKRDGLDIASMAIAIQREHNAKYPPTKHRSGKRVWETAHQMAIPDSLGWSTSVEWDVCAYGKRPRFVQFEFSYLSGNYRKRNERVILAIIHRLELPHWNACIDAMEAEVA